VRSSQRFGVPGEKRYAELKFGAPRGAEFSGVSKEKYIYCEVGG